MKVIPIIADSEIEARRLMRAQFGPEAVVLKVRPLWDPNTGAPDGRVELLAGAPDDAVVASPMERLIEEIRERNQQLGHPEQALPHSPVPTESMEKTEEGGAQLNIRQSQAGPHPLPAATEDESRTRLADPAGQPAGWRAGAALQMRGLLPHYAGVVVKHIRAVYGDTPPATLHEELDLVHAALAKWWKPSLATTASASKIRVLVGPPGVGKTICLSKWLAQVVLLGGKSARVFRLDGRTANTAESLSVYSEILGVPVDRSWQGASANEDFLFVDLPGTDWRDSAAVEELGRQLHQFPGAHVHLVLNAAYEANLMLAQARAFGLLPVRDIIVTHLDEEARWEKIWNLILGTDLSIGFLSAGQNVPGEFRPATLERLLPNRTGGG